MTQVLTEKTSNAVDQQINLSPSLAEVHGNQLFDLDQNLWDIFTATASAHPEREAIVSLWQPAGPDQSSQDPNPTARSECLRWSYRSLRDRAEQVAGTLEKLGCGPGMHLAAILWNCAEWGLLFWATTKIGMTFVPIDPRAADDFEFMLGSTNPQVLVVQDAEAAKAMNTTKQGNLGGRLIRIHCSGETVDGWISLRELISSETCLQTKVTPGATNDEGSPRTNGSYGNTHSLIVFTSGTTGNPKGCPHTNRNLVSQTNDYDPNADTTLVDRWLVHTPVCHIFAINNSLRSWRYGGTVVFAAKSFTVNSTLSALIQEQCTVMSATPTLAKALLSHSSFPSPQDLNLSIVSIAGTMIGPDHISLCREGLGARDAIQAYGMSEGAPLISWPRQHEMLVDGYHPGVGKVLPGAALRICRLGSQEVLTRKQVGELHISGPSVISNYLGSVENDKFYTDASGKWLKTGDQAMIDEKGVVYILGRYKDLIIRGGENINPLKIESTLAEIPGLQVQVVGVPDDIAGQVPVAVVKLPPGVTKAQVSEKARHIGPQYALDAVYTLEELGLETVPVTSIGKPKKALLATLVVKLRTTKEPILSEDSVREDVIYKLEETLLGIWHQLTGVRPAKTDSVFYLADSITLLRYCDTVLRVCGRQIYLQDFNQCDTVEKQAQLLATRDKQPGVAAGATAYNHIQLYHASGGNATYHPSHSMSTQDWKMIQQPLLVTEGDVDDLRGAARERIDRLGLDECQIEDMIPIRSSLHRMVTGQRPQSYHVRVVFRVRDASGQQIFEGLSRALESRPMMRTVLCQTSQRQPYHVVVSPSKQLFRKLIHEVEVQTEEEATELYQDDSTDSHSSAFMFHAVIIGVRDIGRHMMSLTYNHSIIDALTLLPWHRDLDRLIRDSNATIPTQTPYQLFADLFIQYQDSLPSQKSLSFQVQRLRGISRCKQALWPRQRAPGMMISNDQDSPYVIERQTFRDEVWKGEWQAMASEFRFPRRSRVVRLPNLTKLHNSHGLEPAMFTKCALVIFNVLQTRSSVALFNSWESARSWPFVPKWIEASLPPAMSIDGPTVQWVLNLCEVVDDETLLGFFQRMMLEQEQIQRHEHVPWEKVVKELKEEGDVAIDASFRQSFVWDVSMGLAASRAFRGDFETLEPMSRFDWPDCGLFWNAFMVDKDNLFFIASWDTAQMNVDEVDEHCDNLAAVMRRLVDEENWDKPVGQVFPRWK